MEGIVIRESTQWKVYKLTGTFNVSMYHDKNFSWYIGTQVCARFKTCD